jgi:hypothetical protein
MSDLNIQLCPETGICSLVKADGNKVDLMPDEVGQVRDASGDAVAIRQAIAQIDPDFAGKLDAKDVAQISRRLQ